MARLLLAMHRLSWTRPRAAAIGARTTPPGGDPIASLLALPPILKCLEEPAPAEGRVA
ncbi:MAG: hypothetical protein IT452_04540 [Planctomycetia bacterium]|nr:hypothetical protein [Planctomycetia bacterium]